MGDELSDAFDAVDRRWSERQGVFEQRTHHRVIKMVVMPCHDARAREVARCRGVPESVRPAIRSVRGRPRGPYARRESSQGPRIAASARRAWFADCAERSPARWRPAASPAVPKHAFGPSSTRKDRL
jgi:hypothetical protein